MEVDTCRTEGCCELGLSSSGPDRRRTYECRQLRGVLGWGFLLFVCVHLGVWWTPQSAWAGPELRALAPETAAGDGRTPIPIQVFTPEFADRLDVRCDSGRVMAVRRLSPGRFDVTVLPPRVAAAARMVVTTRAGGTRTQIAIDLVPSIGEPGERASGGSLDLRVPRRLVLGHHASGTVDLRPVRGRPVILYASTGTVTALTHGHNGRMQATYRPPEAKYPGVAVIVAATEDGSVVDWAPIELHGRPLVSARSEPNATVSVRVGDEEYGPVTASPAGVAEMRVVTPPGVRVVTALARDAVGNENVAPLVLGVPPFRGTFAVCPPNSERLYYFAVDARGQPREGLALQTEATLGTLASPEQVRPGYYVASLAVPPSAARGQPLTLGATIRGEADSRSTCDTTVPGEAPISLSVELGQVSYRSGSGMPVRILARLKYAGEREPRRVPVELSADLGEVSDPRERSLTTLDATWRPADFFGGREVAVLTARTLGARPVHAQAILRLETGAVSQIEVLAEPARLPADGRSVATITARPRDRAGNLVPGASLVAQARGRVKGFQSRARGTYTAGYVSRRLTSSGANVEEPVVVRDRDGSAFGTVSIELVPTGEHFVVAVRAGYLNNLGQLSAPLAEVDAGVRGLVLSPQLVLGLSSGYYGASDSSRDRSRREEVTWRAQVVPLRARITYEFPTSSGILPVVGATGGVAFAQTRTSAPSAGRALDHPVVPVVGLLAGAGLLLGPGAVLLEGAYGYAPLRSEVLRGNLAGLSLSGGYGYSF